MINIICLKWGDKYGPEYVNYLYWGIKRNTNRDYQFHCFTDNAIDLDPGIMCHPLPDLGLEGWWNKLYLFSRNMPFSPGDRIFFLDLDTLIVSNIDDILDLEMSHLISARDFMIDVVRSMRGGDNHLQSCVMSWRHGDCYDIWDRFITNPQAAMLLVSPHGDQRWIQHCVGDQKSYFQDLLPGRIVSYKMDCVDDVPDHASIVCYHGKPSIPSSLTETTVLRTAIKRWSIGPSAWVANYWGYNHMQNSYKVRFVTIPARHIFGSVGRSGGGYNSVWSDWSDQGRARRDVIMQEYEQALDDLCGHYRQLEDSILREGFRNPITVTCGPPRKRSWEQLPPEMRELPPEQLLILETTTGGSRLHVAQKHDMEIPCIVSDWCGRFDNEPEIRDEAEARMCYLDQPRTITFHASLGFVEGFDLKKVGHHLGQEWSEDRLMPLRAPLWISIMNRHGYRIDRLPNNVQRVLTEAGIDQNNVGQ